MIVGKWGKWLQDMTDNGYITVIIKEKEGDRKGGEQKTLYKISFSNIWRNNFTKFFI